MSLHDADTVFNEFISDSSRGTVLYHDHFVGRAGGIVIFHVSSEGELRQLQNESCLNGWDVMIYPLTFTEKPIEFLYQIDFTMAVYRGIRLKETYSAYENSEYKKNVDSHVERGNKSPVVSNN
jgi:hypothetical protein